HSFPTRRSSDLGTVGPNVDCSRKRTVSGQEGCPSTSGTPWTSDTKERLKSKSVAVFIRRLPANGPPIACMRQPTVSFRFGGDYRRNTGIERRGIPEGPAGQPRGW